MSSKDQKSPSSEAKVTCSDMSTAKETNWKLLRTSTKTKRMPFFFLILNSATPVQLRLKELCGSFYTTLRSLSKRISVKRSVTVFHRSSFYRCKLNIVSIGRYTFQIFHGNVKIVQYERKRRIVIDSDEDDWLWSYVCQLRPVSNLDFHLTLTWSIFQSRKYCLIDKKNRSSNFRINNCFCEIPLQSIFEVLFKLV